MTVMPFNNTPIRRMALPILGLLLVLMVACGSDAPSGSEPDAGPSDTGTHDA